MALRFDLVFSYWIFIWFILFKLKFTKYNPKFILGLGIIENCIMLLFMFLYNTKYKTIIYFIIINLCIKVLPFISLWKIKINIYDIYATVCLFLIYCIWVYINGETISNYYNNIFNSLIYDKKNTPMLSLLYYVEKYFINYSMKIYS